LYSAGTIVVVPEPRTMILVVMALAVLAPLAARLTVAVRRSC
jgi:hypothetical protein